MVDLLCTILWLQKDFCFKGLSNLTNYFSKSVTRLEEMGSVVDQSALLSVTKELKSYTPPSLFPHDIISVLTLHNTREISGNNLDTELIERLREYIPIETLYSFEVLKGTTFVFRIIRDFLRAEGVKYNRHPATDCISWGIVELLYSDKDKIDFAYERLIPHRKNSRSKTSTDQERTKEWIGPATVKVVGVQLFYAKKNDGNGIK